MLQWFSHKEKRISQTSCSGKTREVLKEDPAGFSVIAIVIRINSVDIVPF